MLDLTDWQNKKFVTRNGSKVVILKIDAPGDQPIVGYIEYDHSNSVTVGTWSIDGNFDRAPVESDIDLFNVKTKREGWVNLYHFPNSHYAMECSFVFYSKAEADSVADKDRIACVRIEWEE